MKAEDLRIGNFFQVGKNNDIERVFEITFDRTLGHYANRIPIEVIKGIPLTPEILEKCGFENKYGNTYFIRKLKFSYEHNEISQFVRFHYSGKIRYIQYLHQLQNLFYALVGEELTINL